MGVAGVVFDVNLRGEQLGGSVKNLDVDVGCTARVDLWFDGAKDVSAVLIGDVVTEALEGGIKVCAAGIVWVLVIAIQIALPNLDAVADAWVSVQICDCAAQGEDLSACALDEARDFDQIIVDVWRAHRRLRVVWPLRRGRG